MSAAIAATGLPGKTTGAYVVEWMVAMLKSWGYTDVVLMSDQEPAIQSICEAVAKRRVHRTVQRRSPKYSHASLGMAEQGNWAMESMLRTL